MATAGEVFLERWHALVAKRDLEDLRQVLAEDVSVAAPPYWQRLEGPDVAHRLLSIIIETIEGFTYHREWISGRELALEFMGRVGDLDVQGIDLLTLDAEGRVCRLDVMIRPVNGVHALMEIVQPRMMAFFAERAVAERPRVPE